VISKPGVTLRGADRSTVIIDGSNASSTIGVLVTADGVTVENLTVKNFMVNGVMFSGQSAKGDTTPLVGFVGRYLTALDNGLYGIYTFQATQGVLSDSYASGSPDSSFYVGQCSPCDVLATDLEGAYSAVGFEAANASQFTVVRSEFHDNRVGMMPLSTKIEQLGPQGSATFVGNSVHDNNALEAPEHATGAFGFGIAVGGGNSNTIERNLVVGNVNAGIVVTALDAFEPSGNVVRGNVVSGNGVDLAFWPRELSGGDSNCFTGNAASTSYPTDIDVALGCGSSVSQRVAVSDVALVPSPARSGTIPAPTNLASQPGDPMRPSAPLPDWHVDLDSIGLPS
jgi:hypothetical protein